MINPVLTKNNTNLNYTKPSFKANEQNTIKKENAPSSIGRTIGENSLLGMIIGFFSNIVNLGDESSFKLMTKKIGMGTLLGAATGLAVGIALNESEKNKDKKDHYKNVASFTKSVGVGSIIGSTFLTFTAGDYAFSEWFKGKKLGLWGGIAGGLAGALLSYIDLLKKNKESQPVQKINETQKSIGANLNSVH